MTDLIRFLDSDKSAYHAVSVCENELINKGFKQLNLGNAFNAVKGGRYYIKPQESSLFAFVMPEKISSLRIAMAHTDFPTFKLKPVPMHSDRANLKLVNFEPYGGSLKRTWFDRPLGIAGLVYVKSDNLLAPKPVLFDSEEAWLVIPNLAPHMDREIEKKDIDPAREMNPIVSISGDDNNIINLIADKLGLQVEDILSYDLNLYDVTKAMKIGAKGEFIQSGKLDNMASCAALVNAITAYDTASEVMPLIALFDNEEIGSRTRQGADSNILKWIIDKILLDTSMAKTDSDIISILNNSLMLSCDGAHGVHPNYIDKADTTSTAMLGKGIVIKTSASQRYVTDPKAMAIVKSICDKYNISYQIQANRSGTPGGQTLGPIASSYIPAPAVDMGVPMLAMHSSRELIAYGDYEMFEEAVLRILSE